MKKLIYIFLSGLLLFTSCTEEVLDKEPLDIISDSQVWGDQVLIDAYLTQVYIQMYVLLNETPNQDWETSEDWNGPFIINELSDESKRDWIHGQSNSKMYGIRIDGGILEWWEHSYNAIRVLNEFISRIEDAPVDENFRKLRSAEARFLRAYNYFSMVKRYGGVPIITEAQDINASEEELFLPRDSEKSVYDFILKEMEEIKNDLAEKGTDEHEYGRPTIHTALALKCRAALYAGSVAQYGTVQLDGLIGMNTSDAPGYYQQAYDAAKEIINSNNYALYDQDENKVDNFKNIFLVKQNSEVIWPIRHDRFQRNQGGNGWVWDFFQCPAPQAWQAGHQNSPYLEMIEEFELIDGTPGTLDWDALEQGLWTMEELWENRDPRFFATIYTQDTPWKGGKVDFHNGLLLPDGTIQNDGSFQGVLAKGTQDGHFGTSFGVMKYLDEDHDNMGERATSETDWQIFRYAEVLLNYAEAAYELDKAGDALNAVNQVRERAGIAALSSISREDIRHERKVELAFEGHRYWDLRRWRLAVDELSINRSGLRYILDYETGKFKIQVLERIDDAVANPVFYERMYYFPITKTRTANNPNLVENPGYE